MHRSTAELEQHLDAIRTAPADAGTVEMIVRRPEVDAREEITTAELDEATGLVGDNWVSRRSDGDFFENQLTLMNSRAVAAIAGTKDRWKLAGDQVYVDMDLSQANLPPGSRLSIGDAVIEISATPHTGCAKFSDRFGAQALRFANVGTGRELRIRGVNARVVQGGRFAVGDAVTKV